MSLYDPTEVIYSDNETEEDEKTYATVNIGLDTILGDFKVPIERGTTLKDLKCKTELLSGVPADLFELRNDGNNLSDNSSRLKMSTGFISNFQMEVSPVWQRFISACLKSGNSQVRARIRVKMQEVSKEDRIFVACFVAARQSNSCLLFGLLPCNKMIARTVRLSGRNILHAAVTGGDRNCVANILMNGGSRLIDMADIYGETPLSMARTLNREDIAEMLEVYQMVSSRKAGQKKVIDEDIGYECVIPRRSLNDDQPSDEHENSSSEEEAKDTQKCSPQQDCIPTRDLNEATYESPPMSKNSLDKFANDKTSGENDVIEPACVDVWKDNASTNNVGKEVTASTEMSEKTKKDRESARKGINKAIDEHAMAVNSMADSNRINAEKCARESFEKLEENKLAALEDKENVCCRLTRKREQVINTTTESTKYDNQVSSTPLNLSTKVFCREERTSVAMATRELDLENVCLVERITNDKEDADNPGSHTLDEEVLQNADVLNQEKQPCDVSDQTTGNPIIDSSDQNAEREGKLLQRRRKKGLPSLLISRTSSDLNSFIETVENLDATGSRTGTESMTCKELSVILGNEGNSVTPPIKPLVPKPPTSPVPIDSNRQTRRRKFSTGSPTSGSPHMHRAKHDEKGLVPNDMKSYLEYVWRRSSDSEVNDSAPSPPTRPRSYSTPHPPGQQALNTYKVPTRSNSSDTEDCSNRYGTITNGLADLPKRKQSVGTWVRKTSAVRLTFDQWLTTKNEQHRRNSLTVQRENEQKLSLGNQLPSVHNRKNINYEQWLAIKAATPERKTSQDNTFSFQGNRDERPRAESTRAFMTWLQKKDEEALRRERKLLNDAMSRSAVVIETRNKREEMLTNLILKMRTRKKSRDGNAK